MYPTQSSNGTYISNTRYKNLSTGYFPNALNNLSGGLGSSFSFVWIGTSLKITAASDINIFDYEFGVSTSKVDSSTVSGRFELTSSKINEPT